jgi:hypothetical protein
VASYQGKRIIERKPYLHLPYCVGAQMKLFKYMERKYLEEFSQNAQTLVPKTKL